MQRALLGFLVWIGCLGTFAGCTDDSSKRKADAADEIGGSQNPDAAPFRECSETKPCPPTGNTCLVATCSQGVCATMPAADGTTCDDALVCTTEDVCKAGTCTGTAQTCDDGLTCSKDSCVETMGGCVADMAACSCAKDADCDDKNACNGVESCDPVKRTCLNGAPVSCKTLDNNCNVGMCNPANGTCNAIPKAEGTSCNDGNLCTQSDMCLLGVCGGTAITCSAKDQCHTAGVCNPASGLCSTPTKADGNSCEDGNLCTRGDSCVSGACTAGTSKTCAAIDECHAAGTCAPATGICSAPALADGTTCNDGSTCTNGDVCQAGVCRGAALVCNDGVACTVDSCSETAGCTKDVRLCGCQNNSDCDDGNACNGAETCNTSTLTCSPGVEKDCSASTNACNVGVCNAASGACEAKPRQNGTACNDGSACTQTDSCNAGVCRGQNPIVCSASDQCHAAGSCDAQTGACSNSPKVNGTTCNDGNACTQTDSCQSGACTGANPVACTALDQCHTAGMCNPQSGACSMPTKPNGSACNDTNACTQTDSCQSGICGGGNPVICAAQDQCHSVGACNTQSGICSNPAKTDGTLCSDGNACTQTDACRAGACAGSNPVDCTTADDCHDVGVCDPANGVCSTPAKANGSRCNDMNACTRSDTCNQGACQGANPVACSASDQCHLAGACDSTTGLCSDPAAPDATTCNDGSVCTSGDTCGAGKCAGVAIACDDGVMCTIDACVPAQGGCTVDRSKCGCTINADCNDGNACNGIETCDQKTFACSRGTAVSCATLDNECNTGSCVPATGQCVATARIDGTKCSDSNACTQADSCIAGACRGSNPVVCPAPDQCHAAGTCSTTTGVCSNPAKNDGTNCNDGNACTQTDSCQTGVCTGARPVVCVAKDACHLVGTCDSGTGGCSEPTAPNGTRCTDGDACTQTDICQVGRCAGSNPVTCSALDQCHSAGICNSQSGTCSNPEVTAGTPCSDSNACTARDSCAKGVCVPGVATTCVALSQCHRLGTCDVVTGVCSNPTQPDGNICADTDACTLSDKCTGGTCSGIVNTCSVAPICQQGGMCRKDGVCVFQNMPDRTSCDDAQSCTLADLCSAGACVGSKRNNSSGDWNLTPETGKGAVLSVNLDDFEKGSAVAGAFRGSVVFGNFTVSAASASLGAYVALYANDKTVVDAKAVIQVQRGGSLVVSDLAVHADGSFVLVGTVSGVVTFPTDPKFPGFTTDTAQPFVAAFDSALNPRWIRRGINGAGTAAAVDAYTDGKVIVVGTFGKSLDLETGKQGTFPLTDPGTFAAIYDNAGVLLSAATVVTQGLQQIKVTVSVDEGLAAIQGTGVSELAIGGKENFSSFGGSDVFLFAVAQDLHVAWAQQIGTTLEDSTGGVTAFSGKNGVFASFVSTTGAKAVVRSNNIGTSLLHGFGAKAEEAHLITFSKTGVPINAALIVNRNGLSIRAWDVQSLAKSDHLTVVGTFNINTDIFSAAGFGDGPPAAAADQMITGNDGENLFAARFLSDNPKNAWAINLRGTNAGLGANGNDVLVTVHPDLSATATGIFVRNASFGDQVVDPLAVGMGAFFLSHFNSAAQYDFCP